VRPGDETEGTKDCVMDYFVWTLMLIGWVYLITEAAIFAPVRIALSSAGSFIEALIYCPSCMGFSRR
jgi:hypothetical protein